MASPNHAKWTYLRFLRALHTRLRPRTYLEVGVRAGRSLGLSRARSIGVDPAYSITHTLSAPIHLVRATSDAYFADTDPKEWLGGPIDLAFIDGMHQFEFALRDFINIEKHCGWFSVVVFDDMLPRNVDEAARTPHTRSWTGDVFWLGEVLKTYRPDLTVLLVDTEPTGTAVVLGLDPGSSVLEDHYDEILARYLHDDPQPVPDHVLQREGARPAAEVVKSPVWEVLRRGRHFQGRARGVRQIAAALESPDGYRRRRRALRKRAGRLVDLGRRRVSSVLGRS